MTISIVWQRKFLGVDEIIFASDSRLSAGYRWDCAQKIFPIDGPNFCISFAGDSDFAFPCIFQFQCMVKNYYRFSSGAAPISLMVKDFLSIINQLYKLVDDRKIAMFHKTEFLVVGYDFSSGIMYKKHIRYNEESDSYMRFDFRGLSSGQVEAAIGFAGEEKYNFFNNLGRLIASQKTALDYQPLEVLQQIIASQDNMSSIGGNPQIVKVYRHRNYLPYAVRKNEKCDVTLFGRPLLSYEKTLYPIVTLNKIGEDGFVHYPSGTPNRNISPPPSFSE